MMTGAGWDMGFGGWPGMLLALAVGVTTVIAVVWLVTAALPGRLPLTPKDAGEERAMTTERTNLLAKAILGGSLLLATAGLALALAPNPSSSAMPVMSGGMMSGGMMSGGMMSGGMMSGGMMSGGMMSGGMMSGGMMSGGMMSGGMMSGGMPEMTAMHAAMVEGATCDPELMQSMHQQHQSTD